MLNELAYAQGVEDGLAKFAIMAPELAALGPQADVRKMIPVTPHDPAFEQAMAAYNKEHGGPPAAPQTGTAGARPRSIVPAGPVEQTFVPGAIPKVTSPSFKPPMTPQMAAMGGTNPGVSHASIKPLGRK